MSDMNNGGQIITCHGWSLPISRVIQAVTTGPCGLGVHNAVSMLPGQPEPVTENHHREAVETELWQLCYQCGLPQLDSLLGARGIGRLSALCFPAADRRHLRVCTMAMLVALIFDDMLDSRRNEVVTPLAETLRATMVGDEVGDLGAHPLVQLAEETFASVRALRPGEPWMRRFMHGFNAFFDMGLRARRRWLTGEASLNIEGYLDERYYDIGVGPMLSLMELTHDYILEEHRFDHPELAAFRSACIYNMSFMNDVFSYHKEVLESGIPTNAIAVIQNQFQLSFEQAVAAVVLLALRSYGEFEERTRKILADQTLSYEEKRYVEGMRNWMAGALQWSRESERYRDESSPLPELRDEVVRIDRPSPTRSKSVEALPGGALVMSS